MSLETQNVMNDFEEILGINRTFANLSIHSALLYIFGIRKIFYEIQD